VLEVINPNLRLAAKSFACLADPRQASTSPRHAATRAQAHQMVGCELVLAHVMSKLEFFGTGHRGVGEPDGKQIGESEAFQRHWQQTDGAGPASDVTAQKRENRAVIPKVDSRTADPQQMYRISHS
jgi:hypothetical protein